MNKRPLPEMVETIYSISQDLLGHHSVNGFDVQVDRLNKKSIRVTITRIFSPNYLVVTDGKEYVVYKGQLSWHEMKENKREALSTICICLGGIKKKKEWKPLVVKFMDWWGARK